MASKSTLQSAQSLSKWIQLKIYQVEVTFSVYIFTPLEKFIFWSIVFLLFSLTALATILYLPHHIMFLVGRAWFYIHGDTALEVARETARTLIVQHTKTAAAAVGTETAMSAAAIVAAAAGGEAVRVEL